jgi:hypothetical protein
LQLFIPDNPKEETYDEEGRDSSGSGHRPSGAMVESSFPKNRLRCLLSPLVVMPPCHPWLTPPVVTLTGEREKEENLIRPGIAPARLSRIRETPEAASLFDN